MTRAILRTALASLLLLALTIACQAQQDTSSMQDNSRQAARPAPASNGPGTVGSDLPSPASGAAATVASPHPAAPAVTAQPTSPTTVILAPGASSGDDNPYDPLLEPPPLPKSRTTLIGGIATNIDHVRNHLTVRPFGKGTKIKVVLDERSHIYRNGVETTVLGIHKGDRVYVDTMLDPSDNKVLARNVRVVTELGVAEVRGQVLAANLEKGTISVRDQLSARPVTFTIAGSTQYTSSKGAATASDLMPGALVDVQFAPRRDDRTVAQQVLVLAKPGENYIFSGKITNLDMRTNSMFVDNLADDQTYEVHITQAALSNPRALRIGAEVTARATFDGKQYKASNVHIEGADQQVGEQSKAQ